MSRRHDQHHDRAIDVRRRDDVPEQFRWCGRLYRVSAVLESWTECGPWWEVAARRRRHDSDDLALAPIPASPKWAQRAWGEPAPDLGAAAGPAVSLEDERAFWRVEAGSGVGSAGGVYDLCLDVERGQWSLSAIQD